MSIPAPPPHTVPRADAATGGALRTPGRSASAHRRTQRLPGLLLVTSLGLGLLAGCVQEPLSRKPDRAIATDAATLTVTEGPVRVQFEQPLRFDRERNTPAEADRARLAWGPRWASTWPNAPPPGCRPASGWRCASPRCNARAASSPGAGRRPMCASCATSTRRASPWISSAWPPTARRCRPVTASCATTPSWPVPTATPATRCATKRRCSTPGCARTCPRHRLRADRPGVRLTALWLNSLAGVIGRRASVTRGLAAGRMIWRSRQPAARPCTCRAWPACGRRPARRAPATARIFLRLA